MYEDTIEIRPYIKYILQHGKWIALSAILAAVVTFTLIIIQPPLYAVEATVAVVPLRTEVQFDNRIQTLGDYELVGNTIQTRRDALVALVTSNEIVHSVLAEVRDHLKPTERNAKWLREAINVEAAGDLINIEFEYSDPDIAVIIANTLAEEYEQHVNTLYRSRIAPTDSQIEAQVLEAAEDYQNAQLALESQIAVDPVKILQRELDAKIAVLDNYQQARILALASPIDRNQAILSGYFSELEQTELWLADARALREQITGDTGSSTANLGNAIALITLRARTLAVERPVEEIDSSLSSPNFMVQGPNLLINLDATTVEEVSVGDVDALISALEARQVNAQLRVERFLDGLQAGEPEMELVLLDERIAVLTTEVNALESSIETASADMRELMQSRDSKWETYQLLVQRQVEERVSSQSAFSEVRIADRAYPPFEPMSRGLLINTVLAGLLAALISVSIVIARAWWVHDQTDASPQHTLETQASLSDSE